VNANDNGKFKGFEGRNEFDMTNEAEIMKCREWSNRRELTKEVDAVNDVESSRFEEY
jgi:hypothetical protein